MKRLPMRKIREFLRLAAQGLSTREMAASLAIGRNDPARVLVSCAGGRTWLASAG